MIEREIKIKLTQEQYNQIYSGISEVHDLTVKQTNYYFETENAYFQSNDMMLRIREKKGRYYVAFKKRLEHSSVGLSAFEYEYEIDVSKALEYIKGEEISLDFLRKIDKTQLDWEFNGLPEYAYMVGSMETYRTKFPAGVENLFFELDKSIYFDITDFEIECEYTDELEKEQALEKLLVFGIDLTVTAEAKYWRFTKRRLGL